MKRDFFLFGALALLGYAVYSFLKGRGRVPANQFGAPLVQRPGPQYGFAAPRLNDQGDRPFVSRVNDVAGAVRSGAGIAVDVTDVIRRAIEAFRGGLNRRRENRFRAAGVEFVTEEEFDRRFPAQFDSPAPGFAEAVNRDFGLGDFRDPLGEQAGGFDAGGFDPDRPFDADVFQE